MAVAITIIRSFRVYTGLHGSLHDIRPLTSSMFNILKRYVLRYQRQSKSSNPGTVSFPANLWNCDEKSIIMGLVVGRRNDQTLVKRLYCNYRWQSWVFLFSTLKLSMPYVKLFHCSLFRARQSTLTVLGFMADDNRLASSCFQPQGYGRLTRNHQRLNIEYSQIT